MSAVEALAEVLEAHDLTADGNYTCVCGWSGERQSMGDPTFEQHQASFLVAAIRSMPAEQVVELIGGEVESEAIDGWYKPMSSRVVGRWVAVQ